MATHDVEQARRFDRVLCLHREQIAFGAPDAVLTPEVLAATYGGELVRLPDEPGLCVLPPHHHDHPH